MASGRRWNRLLRRAARISAWDLARMFRATAGDRDRGEGGTIFPRWLSMCERHAGARNARYDIRARLLAPAPTSSRTRRAPAASGAACSGPRLTTSPRWRAALRRDVRDSSIPTARVPKAPTASLLSTLPAGSARVTRVGGVGRGETDERSRKRPRRVAPRGAGGGRRRRRFRRAERGFERDRRAAPRSRRYARPLELSQWVRRTTTPRLVGSSTLWPSLPLSESSPLRGRDPVPAGIHSCLDVLH